MGYDLHITRKGYWADEEGEGSISLSEWHAHVADDPELSQDPNNPGENNYLYLRESGNWPLWYSPELGEINTKNPDIDVIRKLVGIANSLGAKAQGDDGELYDLNGNVVPDHSSKLTSRSTSVKKIWWKFW
jgi:hypothetical protein